MKLSIYDTKTAIDERADDLSFEDFDNEEIYERAKILLLNPHKILGAEMRWFVGCPAEQEKEIVERLTNKSYYAKTFPNTLAELNFNLYSIEYEKISTEAVLLIDALFETQDVKEIKVTINKSRQQSEFSTVFNDADISVELRKLRDEIRESLRAAANRLSRAEYVLLAAKLVEVTAERGTYGKIIKDFFDKVYRQDMEFFLLERLEKITDLIEALKENFSEDSLNALEKELKSYTDAVKPQNKFVLIGGKRGNFENDEIIFYAARKIAYTLNEEQKLPMRALSFAELLNDGFSYIPSLQKLIEADQKYFDKIRETFPSKAFNETKARFDEIFEILRQNLHYKKGFNEDIQFFYLNEFKPKYEQIVLDAPTLEGYKPDEIPAVNAMVASVFQKLGMAMTWTENLASAYELFKIALTYAEKSDDREILAAVKKEEQNWRKYSKQTSTESKSGCLPGVLIFVLVITLILNSI